MKFYGLHFIGNDKTPLQVRVDSRTQQVFARSCPNGQWTSWRRLDVLRNADGTLAEEVEEAAHAKKADAAGRFTRPMRISFSGDVKGEASFDGSEDVTCHLTLNSKEFAEALERINALEAKGEAEEKEKDDSGLGYGQN